MSVFFAPQNENLLFSTPSGVKGKTEEITLTLQRRSKLLQATSSRFTYSADLSPEHCTAQMFSAGLNGGGAGCGGGANMLFPKQKVNVGVQTQIPYSVILYNLFNLFQNSRELPEM